MGTTLSVTPTDNRFDAAGFAGFRTLESVDNEQWFYFYENGFGASVVRGPWTYGGPGLFEIAVLHGANYADAPLCYRTSVTDDVIGWLSEAGVLQTLDAIRALSPIDPCNHKGAR